MKIRIKSEDCNLTLQLPLSYTILKFILKAIAKNKKDVDYAEFLPLIKASISSLKEYRRENGHFELADITSSSGEKVLIVI